MSWKSTGNLFGWICRHPGFTVDADCEYLLIEAYFDQHVSRHRQLP